MSDNPQNNLPARVNPLAAMCDACGTQTAQLDDEDHCAVCRLEYLADEQASIQTSLDAIREAARAAVIHGDAHPSDILAAVYEALNAEDVRSFASGKRLNSQVAAELCAQADAMKSAMLEAVK